ncbi:MAG: diiron oxygenase [Mucilaginibacter sp.]
MEIAEVERLIKISKEHPLLPETYVPWHLQPEPAEIYLPEILNSIEGLSLYNDLTAQQKLDLGRHEAVQVMYSYGWGEGLFCVFMSRYILNLQPADVEYRFLLRELIEEYRHQEMFAQAVQQLNGQPVPPSRMHSFIGKFTTKYLPADYLFMGSISIEMVTDTYGNYSRRDRQVYTVLRKVFELHNIEEGRHIHFTKGLLERYTAKAGYLKRTAYSFVILFNIYFLRTLYVKKEIFERIGIKNTDEVYKLAFTNYKEKFAANCLQNIVDFVQSWNGFNIATRWAWRRLLDARV